MIHLCTHPQIGVHPNFVYPQIDILHGYIFQCNVEAMNKMLTLCLDVDIQGHGIELTPISNLLDFDIDIEHELCCLDVHRISTWNSTERLNYEACLDGHSIHWNCPSKGKNMLFIKRKNK